MPTRQADEGLDKGLKMEGEHFSFHVSEDDVEVAYLQLSGHPGRGVSGVVKKQVRLLDLVSYKGPDVYLDFDEAGCLIGMEFLD